MWCDLHAGGGWGSALHFRVGPKLIPASALAFWLPRIILLRPCYREAVAVGLRLEAWQVQLERTQKC